MRYLLFMVLLMAIPHVLALEDEAEKRALDAGLAQIRLPMEKARYELEKARSEYAKKVKYENDKLVTAIDSAMARETQAGHLESALAFKKLLARARNGELISDFVNPPASDLVADHTIPQSITFDVKGATGSSSRNNIIALPEILWGCRIPENGAVTMWVLGGGGGNTNGDVSIGTDETGFIKIGGWSERDRIMGGGVDGEPTLPDKMSKVVMRLREPLIIPRDAKIKFQYTSGIHGLVIYKASITQR